MVRAGAGCRLRGATADIARRAGCPVIDDAAMLRLAFSLFAVQAGFHGFTASLPLVLARSGIPDAEIGLVVGLASVVQIPAALVGGALVDRFGGIRLLATGAAAYLLGAAILLLPGIDPANNLLPFVLSRVSQGIGLALTLPAALSLVPRFVEPGRQGFGLAFMGSAHNLTLIVMPPLSLAILGDGRTLERVAIVVAAIVVAGAILLATLAIRTGIRPVVRDRQALASDAGAGPEDGQSIAAGPPPATRRFGFAFRRAWILPLATILLYVAHWGVVTAYLPQRAELAGANVGLFFAADGVAVLALRIPSGWLADRMQPRWLMLGGLLATVVAIALLVLPPTTPILILAGALTGGGAGAVMTPVLVELSHRSTDADRGSAFAMFSVALAAAIVLGSIGAAPIISTFGFEATIAATIGGLILAALLTLADPGLVRARPAAGMPPPA